MVFNKRVGSFILVILVFSITSCGQTPKSSFELEDSLEKDLCEFVSFLDSVNFVGNFGFDSKDTSIVFGDINKEILIQDKYVKIFKKHFTGGVERGSVNNKSYTYFIIDGFFREGNYGILFSKSNYFDKNDDVDSCRLLKKSNCSNGNWFFVEAKL
jgi:hypothetical protein